MDFLFVFIFHNTSQLFKFPITLKEETLKEQEFYWKNQWMSLQKEQEANIFFVENIAQCYISTNFYLAVQLKADVWQINCITITS